MSTIIDSTTGLSNNAEFILEGQENDICIANPSVSTSIDSHPKVFRQPSRTLRKRTSNIFDKDNEKRSKVQNTAPKHDNDKDDSQNMFAIPSNCQQKTSRAPLLPSSLSRRHSMPLLRQLKNRQDASINAKSILSFMKKPAPLARKGVSERSMLSSDSSQMAGPNKKWEVVLNDDNTDSFSRDNTNNLGFVRGLPSGVSLPPGITEKHFRHDKPLRRLSSQISRSWGTYVSTTKAERRLHDFILAQNMRKNKFGHTRPWGIMGLYHHLEGIRDDVEWAEDAAWRRDSDEPYVSWSDWNKNIRTGLERPRPFITLMIISICTGTLICGFYLNRWNIEPFRNNLMIGPKEEVLVTMGAKDTWRIVNDKEYWRLFTSMFLHAGVIHYLFNMVTLWMIGQAVEYNYGSVNVALIFVLTDVFGTMLSSIFVPQYTSVGASGGVFGLIGACLADIFSNWKLLTSKKVNVDGNSPFRHIVILATLLLDVALNCTIGLTPFVDNFSHLGGLTLGFLYGLITGHHISSRFFGKKNTFMHLVLRLIGIFISVTAITIAAYFLTKSDGVTSPCTKCLSLSCVPFPFWKEADDKWWYCD